MTDATPYGDDPRPVDIDGVLDLHMFRPRDLKTLVPDYLEECAARGLRDVRIIHGKGIGVQREIVHGILKRHPLVESFGPPHDASGWGATVVRLRDRITPPTAPPD